jgi:ubiquitin carboxyl-terminal hydrolase 4/11/15
VFHLKRFSNSGKSSFRSITSDKIDVLVDFPLTDLNLNDYIQGPKEAGETLYDLYAVSNHFGGIGGGHC